MARTTIGVLAWALVVTGLIGPAVTPVAAEDPPVLELTIDIKPCKDPNYLTLNTIGWLPVAIYEDLELDDVRWETVTLEGVPAGEWVLTKDELGVYIVVRFPAAAVIETLGKVEHGDTRTFALFGELTDGTTIWAADEVVIVLRGRSR